MIFEQVGDVITCTSRPEGGWWKGILRGREGVFPDNFVKVRNVTRCQKWILGTPTKEFVKVEYYPGHQAGLDFYPESGYDMSILILISWVKVFQPSCLR